MWNWTNSTNELPDCMNMTLNNPNSNPYNTFLRVRATNESDADRYHLWGEVVKY